MTRILRRTLVALLLILYGSVSLCGVGLHALAEPSGSHVPTHEHDSKSIRAEPSHCSLCEFQAQGQLATEPIRVVSQPLTSPHVRLILAVVATRDRHPSSSPRAPPIGRLAVPMAA
jgi:hypothetical protein